MRTLEELTEHAVLHWPEELLRKEETVSVLPRLLRTQAKFISILNLADYRPDAWLDLVDRSEDMPSNLFLKHLMVLTDIGGEFLNKITPLTDFFTSREMEYVWRDRSYSYRFEAIHQKTPLHNKALLVDGPSAVNSHALTPKMKDVAMLLLHGGFASNGELPEQLRERCTVGELLGKSDALEHFVRQNYIHVSRQIIGAASNTRGKIAEEYVVEVLERELPDWTIRRNGGLPGVRHKEDGKETTFDVVAVSPKERFFGIEVSFQVTTNSVIERKAREARERQRAARRERHGICYVVDGVGNIKVRRSAVSTICQYSDFTVTFSEAEIKKLAEYLRGQDG